MHYNGIHATPSTLNNIKLLNYPRALKRDLYGLQQGVMCVVITFLTHLGTEKNPVYQCTRNYIPLSTFA